MDDIRIPSDFSTSVVNTGKWWYELIHIYIVIPSLLVGVYIYIRYDYTVKIRRYKHFTLGEKHSKKDKV